MQKFYSLLLGLLMAISANAQNVLLDVPISPVDSLQDQSVFNNPVNWFGLPPIAFAPDENNLANSAFECGVRTWMEIDYSNFVNLPMDTLSFYVKIIMEDSISNPFFPFPASGTGLIFVHESNLGLIYNYADSTITDFDSLIAFKVNQPFGRWLNLRLSYYPDSTVELWVDNALIGAAQRNTNQLLDTNGRLGLGLNPSYLHARVDSIRLVRGTPPVIVGIEASGLEKVKSEMLIYPNPTRGQLTIQVDKSMLGKRYSLLNLSGQSQMQGTFSKQSKQFEISQLAKGVYLLSVPEIGASKKVVVY